MNTKQTILPLNYRIYAKYSCKLCARLFYKFLHLKHFKRSCNNCGMFSHLKAIQSSFSLLYSHLKCQNYSCKREWTEKMPFKTFIINTPICYTCGKLTKIIQVAFRNNVMNFKNSSLFKCLQCNKSKTVGFPTKKQVHKVKMNDEKQENQEISPVSSGCSSSTNFSQEQTPKCENCKLEMRYQKNLKSIFTRRVNRNGKNSPKDPKEPNVSKEEGKSRQNRKIPFTPVKKNEKNGADQFHRVMRQNNGNRNNSTRPKNYNYKFHNGMQYSGQNKPQRVNYPKKSAIIHLQAAY
jgi:hypothetical protein